jgi:glycerate 2-kinase
MRVLVAPDTFKGTLSAVDVARAIAAGWLSTRPRDELWQHPLADGGEGTLDAIFSARPDARRHIFRGTGEPGRAGIDIDWLTLDDDVAIVELATACGLSRLPELAPMTANTYALGEVIAAALTLNPQRLYIALGGSRSTDGGTGALSALGAEFTDMYGRPTPLGGRGLRHIRRVDLSRLTNRPSEVFLLTDVRAPLLGRWGAAACYGPQKGATPAQVLALETGLANLAVRMPGSPDTPSSGAAGGAAYGFATAWDADLISGFDLVAAVTHLHTAIRRADLVITGEGRLDVGSWDGKVVGSVARAAVAYSVPTCVVAGNVDRVATSKAPVSLHSLVDVAAVVGSVERALTQPAESIAAAAARLAASFPISAHDYAG